MFYSLFSHFSVREKSLSHSLLNTKKTVACRQRGKRGGDNDALLDEYSTLNFMIMLNVAH